MKDCVTVGLSNAQVEGVLYDPTELPNNWYFEYKSILDDKKPENKLKRVSLSNGQVKLIPKKPEIPRPIVRPHHYVVPVFANDTSSSNRVDLPPIEEVFPSEPVFSSTELYIPESKPFLAVNKMYRISSTPFSPVEEW